MVHDSILHLYIGTCDGIQIGKLSNGSFNEIGSNIQGNAVRDIAVHPENPLDVFIGCGLRGWGLYHTEDGGKSVDSIGFMDQWVWGVSRHPLNPEKIFVGTEPPMIYVSSDNGITFEPFEKISSLPSKERWMFFHDPFHEGHIHGITIHPEEPERVFAGVEHGALIYSHDNGKSWHEALIGSDVHRLAIHPEDADHIFTATGAGLYQSLNAGKDWEIIPDLQGKYLHSIEFDFNDSSTMYAYSDGNTPIFKSQSNGQSWTALNSELPPAQPADNLRVDPSSPQTIVYAGDIDNQSSQLFISTNGGENWEKVGDPFPKIWRLEVASFD